MGLDRDVALKKAEKLLRQGKLDGAIEAYVRLVELCVSAGLEAPLRDAQAQLADA